MNCDSPMMPNVRGIIVSVRSLLGGTAAFMVGNSLLAVVLPLRMEAAGYPVALTGAIMATYYFGLALGGLRSKRVIFRIGHIRAFAVFAALTASATLAYAALFRSDRLARSRGCQRVLHCRDDGRH